MKGTYRRFCVQRSYYYDTHDGDGSLKPDALSEQEWRDKILQEWLDFDTLGLDENLIIFHDEDIMEDGNPKGLHVHSVPHFKSQRSEESVMKLLGASSVQNCKHCTNYSGAVQYLIHVTQDAIRDMKTIYLPEKIIGYALNEDGDKVQLTVRDIQKRMRRATENQKEELEKVKSDILAEVAEGKMLVNDVAKLYQEDDKGLGLNLVKFYKEKGMYREAEQDYLATCSHFYQMHPHPSTLIYITGLGGTGKTTLANAIAERVADVRGIHFVAPPGKSTTFDFAGNYKGQKVSIFNESPPYAFNLEQFLDITDPQRAAMVNSRHADKPYFAEYLIFTASMSFEKFLYEMWKPYANDNANLPIYIRNQLKAGSQESDWHNAYVTCGGNDVKNKFAQLRRRFALIIDLKAGGYAEISTFDKHYNPSYSLLFPSKLYPLVNAFKPYKRVVYDVTRESDTVKMLTNKTVDAVIKAVKEYYVSNGFALPDSYAKPFD